MIAAELPVAIIGAGPVGLAAAAQLLDRGVEVVIYESGPTAGTAIASWGHTRLFTPWAHLVDEAAARLLDGSGWESPAATRLPLGSDFLREYLLPLAATPQLASRIRYNSTVTDVSRRGMDRTSSEGRAAAPFVLRLDSGGVITDELARAVIDTSGSYGTPNPVAANGLAPAHAGEVQHQILPALPDVLGTDRELFASRHTLVVGAGHSAANTLLKLAALAEQQPGVTISWAIRGAHPTRVYGSEADELAARGELGSAVRRLVSTGVVALIDGFEIEDVRPTSEGRVLIEGRRHGENAAIEADLVVNATGFRPNLAMLRELRLALDEVVEAPRALAPLIDPALHSCGTVYPHGVDELSHPEPDFYIAGMKSYGRAPTFLLLTGYEQVRSIADELAGDSAAARVVNLVLPETGLCSTVPEASAAESSCCAVTAG